MPSAYGAENLPACGRQGAGSSMVRILALIALTVCLLSGCATIINSDSQYVSINSQPPGASVYLEGNYFITPAKVLLKRGHPMKDLQLIFQKEGYKPAYANIEQRPSGWLWLNIFNGVIPGVTIDFITGGAFNLTPSEISVKLEEAAK